MYLCTGDGDVCFTFVLTCDGGIFGQDQVRDATVFRKYTYFIVEGVSVGILILNAMLFIVWIEGFREAESIESSPDPKLADDLELQFGHLIRKQVA